MINLINGELTDGRDFDTYIEAMDAGLAQKISDIVPHVRPGLIVDKGCGSGNLLAAYARRFPKSDLVGVDLSDRLLRAAKERFAQEHISAQLVRGDITEQHFEDGSLTTVTLSSVVHEIYSYNGYDRRKVHKALRKTRRELALGGRLIIRDPISPPDRTVWMRCDTETEERFRRFARDFKRAEPSYRFKYSERNHDAKPYFVLPIHEANEFLSKKDFLSNWDQETLEEFGVFTARGWRALLEYHHFAVVSIHTYVNEWVRANRYQGKVSLYADQGDRPGEPVDFPDTTAVIVGEAV